jgi:hypothetical protein
MAQMHKKLRPGKTLCGRDGMIFSNHALLYTANDNQVECKNCLKKMAQAKK